MGRSGDGKRNILWGWPNVFLLISFCRGYVIRLFGRFGILLWIPVRSVLQARRRPAFSLATFVMVKTLESDSPVPVKRSLNLRLKSQVPKSVLSTSMLLFLKETINNGYLVIQTYR